MLTRRTPFKYWKGWRYSPILPVTGEKYDSDVGSTYPGAGEGPKGMAVRHLKSYASWVQTVQRQMKVAGKFLWNFPACKSPLNNLNPQRNCLKCFCLRKRKWNQPITAVVWQNRRRLKLMNIGGIRTKNLRTMSREAKAPVETTYQPFAHISAMNEGIVQCNEQSLGTCVRQVGLLSTAGVDSWGDLTLVREDRVELTSGLSAVLPRAPQSSYVGNG